MKRANTVMKEIIAFVTQDGILDDVSFKKNVVMKNDPRFGNFKYCKGAEAILQYDGGSLYSIMSGEFGWGLRDAIQKIARDAGYYLEAGTNVYSGLYKN